MNQFTRLLILIFIVSGFSLSASEAYRVDTTATFNEITDIELRLKEIANEVKKSDSITVVVQDSTLVPVYTDVDTIVIEELVELPKKESAFTPSRLKTSLDSLYTRKDDGTIKLPEQVFPYDLYIGSLSFQDTMFYNPLFVPVVFTGRIEPADSVFFKPKEEEDKLKGILIPSDQTFAPILERHSFINKVRGHYFREQPADIKLSTSALSGLRPAASDQDVSKEYNPFKELLSSQTSYSLDRPDVKGTEIDRVYWIKTGDHSLQFSQNYLSPNWHRGGTSNLNINSNHVIDINYQKDKVRFNNRIEWRLSIYNAPDDSLRNYRIGNDMFRYYGDFGLDAFLKSWSYSTNLEAKTQIFKSHQSNKNELRSAFLSPLYVNAGIGMKYNLDKRSKTVRNRRVRLSLALSPLSINYRYVGNNEVDRNRYGIPEGDKSLLDKGSTITSNMTYDFTKYITWESRFKYFTNYSKVEAELENTLTMSLTQMFSTRLYLNLRFDDSVPSHEDYKYLQINEVLSFGLNYKW